MPDGRRQKLRAYQCRNTFCPKHAYASEALDEYVAGRVLAFLKTAGAELRAGRREDARAVTEARKELEAAQYALEQFRENRKAIVTLGRDTWNEWLEDFVVARDAAEVELAAVQGNDPPDYTLVAELWEAWTDESRREFLSKVIGVCTVEPNPDGRRVPFDERVAIELAPDLGGVAATLTRSGVPDDWEVVFTRTGKSVFGDEDDNH